jgi:spoIIIJ-associated protein
MEWVETTGKSVEDALDAALDQLGVDEQDVEYEVLAQPRGGIFGRFGSEARIRARVKPISREKPGERRRRPRRSGGDGRDSSGNGNRGSGSDGGTRPASRRKPRRRSGSGSASGSGSGSGGGGGTSRSRDDGKRGSSVNEEREDIEVPIAVQAGQAEEFTRGLVDAFGAKAEVSSTITDDVVLIEVTGENVGMLVGPRGATLSAIEELIRTVVQRQTGGHGARLRLDVGGYRAKRREALAQFTRDLVQRVLDSGTEQVLEPMPAPDRKVVHDVVAEFDGVSTASEGEEPRRRVVIRRA